MEKEQGNDEIEPDKKDQPVFSNLTTDHQPSIQGGHNRWRIRATLYGPDHQPSIQGGHNTNGGLHQTVQNFDGVMIPQGI